MKPFSTTLAVAFLASVAGSAQADDWSGCHVSAGTMLSTGSGTAFDRPYADGPLAGSGVTWGGTTPSFGLDSGNAGGIRAGLGCDRQMTLGGRPFVLGIVADVATGFAGGAGANPASSDVQFSYDIDTIATLRGRAGLLDNRSLYYVTGGLALANSQTRAFDTSATPGVGTMDVAGSGSDLGWVVGAGIEWQLKSNMSMTLEFLHHEFNGPTATGQATFPTVAYPRFDSTMQQDSLSIGFNWRL